jgi:hypothetical protein
MDLRLMDGVNAEEAIKYASRALERARAFLRVTDGALGSHPLSKDLEKYAKRYSLLTEIKQRDILKIRKSVTMLKTGLEADVHSKLVMKKAKH